MGESFFFVGQRLSAGRDHKINGSKNTLPSTSNTTDRYS